jgi:hypothetical protein
LEPIANANALGQQSAAVFAAAKVENQIQEGQAE